jgi:hypothetical protein
VAYTTTALLKSYMGITASTDDTLLSLCIDRAQSTIESYTNRVFEASADTTRKYTPIIDRIGSGMGFQGSLIDDYTLDLDYDLISITSITNGDTTNIPTASVVTLPLNFTPAYAIRIKQASGYFWTYTGSPEASVSIVGRFGYSLTAPANIVQATLRIASQMYRQRDGSPDLGNSIISADGSTIVTSAMSRDIEALLKPYRRRS